MALISKCKALARSWILEKGFPSRADLIFGKSQKSHGANWSKYGGCSIKRIPLSCDQGTSVWCELCEELHCRDATGFKTDLESVPLTGYAEELLAKLKLCNMTVIVAFSGIMPTVTSPWVLTEFVNILFLERKPLFRTSRHGSYSTSHTTLERLSFIMKKEIQHSSPVTTSEKFLGPFASNISNQLRQTVRWGTHLAHLLDRPSCSWTIARVLP